MYSKKDYEKDIDMIITRDGRVAISMSEMCFIKIVNQLYDGAKYVEGKGYKYLADSATDLWATLIEKEDICRETLKVNPEEVE